MVFTINAFVFIKSVRASLAYWIICCLLHHPLSGSTHMASMQAKNCTHHRFRNPMLEIKYGGKTDYVAIETLAAL